MQLGLPDDQRLIIDSFDDMFAAEADRDRIRISENTGFDKNLWNALARMGTFSLRVPIENGGSEASLFDAVLILDSAGAHLATGPLAGAIVSARILAETGGDADLLRGAMDGSALVTFAPQPIPAKAESILFEGGAHADAVIAQRGTQMVVILRPDEVETARDLGAGGFGRWSIPTSPMVLASGSRSSQLAAESVAEWRLLTAAALVGLGRRALHMASDYASERVQFDRPIATFQGIAHPLANAITEIEGARLLVWDAVWRASRKDQNAAPIAMAFAWAAEAATRATATALHTFGGYGLTLEYDVQLYHRRAKAWSGATGDPQAVYLDVAEDLWGNVSGAIPKTGEVPVDFSLGHQAEEFRARVQEFLAQNPSARSGRGSRQGWDGHQPEFHRSLAQANLAFASWPAEFGGLDKDPYEMTAMLEELYQAGVSLHPIANARMVGETLLKFASPELLDEVLPRICRGEALICLGYTEPEAGSDLAAAKTRAVRDGDKWVINGQKMFTSGADICEYVFLLTRTDPDAKKHRGLTMFLVPLDTPGIEVRPIHTLSDEKTNATFYSDVRVPDQYRIGEVNGGMGVIGYALEIEHGGGGLGLFAHAHADAVEAAVGWARTECPTAPPPMADPLVRIRLARAATRAHISSLFNLQSLWRGAEGLPNRGEGPMSKLFSAETYIEDSADLLDLAAPESLISSGSPGALSDGELEFAYRLSTATSIYGGSSEIMRSMIAESVLGMPRSRS